MMHDWQLSNHAVISECQGHFCKRKKKIVNRGLKIQIRTEEKL